MSVSAAAAVVLAFGFARSLLALHLRFRPFDDSYITFRYALNLSSGFGLTYNPGELVLGTTSPLWAVVLGAFHRAGMPIPNAAFLLSLAADVLSALLIRRLLSHLGYRAAVSVGASVLFLCMFDFLSLSRSGMETSLFVLLTIAALTALAEMRLPMAAGLSSAAVLTRPEGVLLVAIVLVVLRLKRRTISARTTWVSVGLIGLILGAWSAYATVAYGSVIPQSVIAKAATSGDADLARLSWMNLLLFFAKGQYGGEIFARTYLQLMPLITGLAAIGLVVLLVRALRTRGADIDSVLLLAVFPLAYTAGLAVSHAFTFFPWYYGPLYPFLAMLSLTGADAIHRRGAAAACAVLVVAQCLAAWTVKVPADRTFWVEGYEAAARSIPRDPHIRTAAFEIGAVGWDTWPGKIIDLAGLVTPEAVGREPREYLKSVNPDYLVLRTDDAAAFLHEVALDPWFAEDYEMISTVPDVYVRREFVTYARRPVSVRKRLGEP